MLDHFFKLNEPFEIFDEGKMISSFSTHKDFRNVEYKPNQWPNDLKSNNGLTFCNVSLSKTKFKEVTFTECKFEDCLFIGSEFHNVEFHRCKFINCNFHKVQFQDCYIDPSYIFFDRKYQSNSANIGVHLYKQLHGDASRSRQHEFERKADILFRRWKRYQLGYDYESRKISWLEL